MLLCKFFLNCHSPICIHRGNSRDKFLNAVVVVVVEAGAQGSRKGP